MYKKHFFDGWLLFEEIIIARNYCVERLLIFLPVPIFFVLNILCIFSTPYVRIRVICFVLALYNWELDCITRQIEFWSRTANIPICQYNVKSEFPETFSHFVNEQLRFIRYLSSSWRIECFLSLDTFHT